MLKQEIEEYFTDWEKKKKLLHQSTDAGFCLLTSAPIHLRTVTLLDQGDA